jgi:hypothetical protein
LGAIYLIYFGIRSIVVAGQKPTPEATAPKRAEHAGNDKAHAVRKLRSGNWEVHARHLLHKKPFTERIGELMGSFLMSAIVSGVMCLVMMIVGGVNFASSIHAWSFFTWLTICSIAGSWIVLALGKLWESSEGEQVRRRFGMLVAGLLFGAFAFGSTQYLTVEPQEFDSMNFHTVSATQMPSMYAADGSPLLPGYLAYFAGLLVILRWWKQADPLRKTRLSLWATAMCVLWAWIVNMFWPFPQPWGFMLAATMSVAVQLSAPWIGPKERMELRKQAFTA